MKKSLHSLKAVPLRLKAPCLQVLEQRPSGRVAQPSGCASRRRRALLWLAFTATLLPDVPAQENPVKWSFGAPAVEGKTAPGALLKVKLAAKIEEGWHLYSLKRIEGGPIPTTIRVPEGQPFAIKGDIDAPAPLVQKDPVFDAEVEYYDGEAEFSVPVKVATDAKPGAATLKVTVRYQSCNEKLCLPPRVVTLEQAVKIAPR